MVNQGEENGAYSSGGYNPDNVYSDMSTASAIEGIGKVFGASIVAKSSEDKNQINIDTKKRLQDRQKNISSKIEEDKNSGSENLKKQERLNNRLNRVKTREQKVVEDIKKYDEKEKSSDKFNIRNWRSLLGDKYKEPKEKTKKKEIKK